MWKASTGNGRISIFSFNKYANYPGPYFLKDTIVYLLNDCPYDHRLYFALNSLRLLRILSESCDPFAHETTSNVLRNKQLCITCITKSSVSPVHEVNPKIRRFLHSETRCFKPGPMSVQDMRRTSSCLQSTRVIKRILWGTT